MSTKLCLTLQPEERKKFLELARGTRWVDGDYDAVVTSRAELLLHSGGVWPREGFTFEENLADLLRHEQEHKDRVAFTYTLTNPAETECVGCLYIQPLKPLLQRVRLSVEHIPDESASVTFWVRQSRLQDHLDRRFLLALVPWFQREWAFSRVVFRTRKVQSRQIHMFEEMGMVLQYTLPKSVLYLPL